MIDTLQNWIIGWAESSIGPLMLGILSAAEAVFFPLPPDPLLIALALAHPERALAYGVLTTVTSIAGGLVGHWTGTRFGRPILRRFHKHHVDRVEQFFQKYGFWAVVIAGFTPLPFKIFTISAGVFGVPRIPFILASIAGRAGRFMLISMLIFVWGDRFQQFLDEQFDSVMIVIGTLLVATVGVWMLWGRRKNNVQRQAASGGCPDSEHEVSGGANT